MAADHTELIDPRSGLAPWLAGWLDWLDAALHREILRLRARYELSMDELRGLYVSDEQVDRLVRRTTDPADAERLAGVHGRLASLLAQAQLSDSPLSDVAARFRLAEVDVLAVVVCLAAEVDLAYQSLFAYLNDDVARRTPTVDLCERLCGSSLQPDSPSVATGMIEVQRQSSAPLWRSAGLVLAEPARRYLLGAARRQFRTPAHSGLTVLTARLPQDADAEALAWSARLGRELVRVEGAALEAALLEARLVDGVLHVVGEEQGLLDDAGTADARRLCRRLSTVPVPVLLSVPPDVADRLPLDGVDHERVDLQPLSTDQRAAAWSGELLRHGLPLVEADVDEVARLYRLSATQIRSAAQSVARSGEVGLAQLRQAARRTGTAALAGLAERVDADYTWDDLVLPTGTLRRLRELAEAIRHRDEIFGGWSFGRLVGGHSSVRAMFAGPSGTGKTMSTAVLGAELGLDVFRVDLSAVVSKYIGETEKNLERILGAAEQSNVIVLFDEADALFGKRSEVKDAHDRYANVEVAFLLQRLESFDGVVVLATNLAANLDEAFSRRLHFTVDFPPPDEAGRLELWRRAFPAEAPLADDIDPHFLATMFALTGGEVRAASLMAAFLAAHDRTPISMHHVVRALARLRRQQGKLPTAAEFRDYLRVAYDEDG